MRDLLDPDDLPAHDAKARDARERFRLQAVERATGSELDAAYGALDAEFGVRGELERREVIAGWLDRGADRLSTDEPEASLAWKYWLLVAHDARTGELAGVRDCHVTVDAARAIAVVYLAHTLVLPAYRRSGLAALFRAAPVTLGRRAIAGAGLDADRADLLLAAEMEPADPAAPDTLVRLIAYGRAGFAAILPTYLPYCQPDFRDLDALSVRTGATQRAEPLALLAIVKHAAHDGEVDLAAPLAAAFVRHLYAVFATHCRAADLAAPRAHALATLGASGLARIPLARLPKSAEDRDALAPLLRTEVLRFHLPGVR